MKKKSNRSPASWHGDHRDRMFRKHDKRYRHHNQKQHRMRLLRQLQTAHLRVKQQQKQQNARTTKHWIMSNWETTKDWK